VFFQCRGPVVVTSVVQKAASRLAVRHIIVIWAQDRVRDTAQRRPVLAWLKTLAGNRVQGGR
jgi:hypothetical protein